MGAGHYHGGSHYYERTGMSYVVESEMTWIRREADLSASRLRGYRSVLNDLYAEVDSATVHEVGERVRARLRDDDADPPGTTTVRNWALQAARESGVELSCASPLAA